MKRQCAVLPDVDDPDFAPFWEAARNQQLVVPKCEGCDRYVWPPRPICPHCYTDEFSWTPVPTEGTLFSWTVVHHSSAATMDPGYIVAIVDLDDTGGVRLLGNIWDHNAAELRVGMPVVAEFDRVSEGVTLVNWRVIADH